MYAVQFIFKPGTYDEEFYTLDGAIEEFVAGLPGFLGVEKWVSLDGDIKNPIYYFENKETLKEFSRFPEHIEAKGKVHKWYDGYQVVVTEVIASYGDGNLPAIASEVNGKGSFYAG